MKPLEEAEEAVEARREVYVTEVQLVSTGLQEELYDEICQR